MLEERVLVALEAAGRPLDDDELAGAIGVARQAVNQVCRRLHTRARIDRSSGAQGKIRNAIVAATDVPAPKKVPVEAGSPGAPHLLSEDEVKAAVQAHLQAAGYSVKVMWGRERGMDIDATGPGGRLVIEAKGEVLLKPQQVNYFLGALGELVQRMDDPRARYGLALPDNRQYRGLVARLPALARQRLQLAVFFVSRDGDRLVVRQDGWSL